MYRILLVESHIMVREGIKKIIEEFADLQVVGEVPDGMHLLDFMKRGHVDMVIIDIYMPDLPGIDAARIIKRNYPDIKVLILTMHKKKEYLKDALSAGFDGYLLKEDSAKELLSAVQNIRQGEIYVSPLLSHELAALYAQSHRKMPENPLPEALTAREIEIIKLITEGKSSKDIAAHLFLSFRTVQNHRTKIMRKLNLKKNINLVRYAIKMGYTPAAAPVTP
jgi:DNA-binding NarL/FixJ family response regulator